MPLHRSDEVAHVGVDVLGAAVRADRPQLDVHLGRPVEVTGLVRLLLGLPAFPHGLRPLPVAKGRRAEDERGDPLRVGERELERHPPAERPADHGRSFDPELVEHVAEILDVRERRARIRRLAEAAQVDGDDRPFARQDGNLAAPHPPVGDPLVHEEHRRSAASDVVRDGHWSARIA